MGNYTGNAEQDAKMNKFSNIIETFKKDIYADKKIAKWQAEQMANLGEETRKLALRIKS